MSKKLNPNQQAWVDALRSGEYKQTEYCLQDESGYCCLGVACVVADKASIPIIRRDDGTIRGGSLDDQLEVKNWLGLKQGMGEFTEFGGIVKLTSLNDTKGKTFSEIADIIEASARSLFND